MSQEGSRRPLTVTTRIPAPYIPC